jgi:SAM-dependent methyltransferase
MGLIEEILVRPKLRQKLWAWWYPFFTRRVREQGIDFLNYAYADAEAPRLTLAAADVPNRPNIQLYEHVRGTVELRGLRVLEVSCGHGGGASYFTRTYQPAEYVGIDLNPEAIRHCRARHQAAGLRFEQGDAQKLPFADAYFDVVVNVEASHCYPDFPGFLAKAARALKTGGHLLYADFRFRDQWADWEHAIAQAPFEIVQTRDIGTEVLRGMELNAKRNAALICERLPKFLHSLGRDFAGLPGARVYEALKSGELSYRSWCFRKS